MDAVQLSAVLLRNLLPDLKLTPGATFVGRVIERHQGHGLLSLAGTVLVAELPEHVPAGQRLRLAVQEVDAQAVIMRIVPEPSNAAGAGGPPGAAVPQQQQGPATPTTPAALAVPLPDGTRAQMRLEVDEDPGDPTRPGESSAPKAVTVHYESPTLGRLDVRLVLGPKGLAAGVGAAPGTPVELAAAHAAELREALSRAMGRPVEVHVGRRTERARVDLRA